MKKEHIEKLLGLVRAFVEEDYAKNADDPTFDIDLHAGLIIERTDNFNLVPLPDFDKEQLCRTIHYCVDHMDQAPEPFHGVMMVFAGYRLDAQTRERVGEMVMCSIETDVGQHAELVFDVTRKEGKTQCLFKAQQIIDEPLDTAETGNMQGFFHKKKHTRH